MCSARSPSGEFGRRSAAVLRLRPVAAKSAHSPEALQGEALSRASCCVRAFALAVRTVSARRRLSAPRDRHVRPGHAPAPRPLVSLP